MRALVRTIWIAAGIVGMAGTAHAARHYYAACQHPSHGALGYSGPGHRDPSAAARDCDAHRKDYPRHACTIQSVDY